MDASARSAALEGHLDSLDDMRRDLASLRILVRGTVSASEGLGQGLLQAVKEAEGWANARAREREGKLAAEADR